MTSPVTRRGVVLSAVGAAIAATGPGGFSSLLYAQSTVTSDQFLALSKSLTGTSDLDPDVARTLLGGFLAAGYGSALAALATGDGATNPVTRDLVNAIVAAWYSGVYDTGQGQAVATFHQALVWSALSFTKPFGECGGETGYWADPPQT